MPRVPEYQSDVSMRPIFQQELDANANAEAFGAGIGRGMQSAARGLDMAGDAIAQVRALEDEAAVRRARNQYITEADGLKYDPDSGFLQKDGRAAIDAFDTYNRDIGGLRKSVAASAKLTPAQQNMFSKAIDPLELDSRRQGLVHKGQSLKSYIVDDLKSSIQTFGDQAMKNANNPSMVQKYIAAGQLELRRQGELQGWGADTLKLQEADFVSGVHKNIALRIAQKDPIAADEYMKANAKQMTGADQYALSQSLETELVQEKSKREAEAILSGGRAASTPDASGASPASGGGGARRIGQAGPTRARAYLQSVSNKSPGAVDNLDNSFATNLAAMMQDAPPEIRKGLGIYSGYRSPERQAELFSAAVKKYGSVAAARKWVAPPGRSQHGEGRAVDLAYNGTSLSHAPQEVVDWVHQNAGKYGLYFPMKYEPWHIEPKGSRGGAQFAGTVAPRNNSIAPRSVAPSYDDIETKLNAISDPDVRDATRKRLYSAMEAQSKAQEANEKQAKAEMWKYIDQGQTPDQVPMEVRQAAGMAAVSAAWSYQEAANRGRDVNSDEKLLYDMRKYAATNPTDFANVDLNDYRDRLSKDAIKELTGNQTTALTDQKKARENGINLTEAFSQAQTQLEAVGITTTGKQDSAREDAAKRVAQFQNALAAQMEEFKRTSQKNPNQLEIQSMINRLLLPVVIKDGAAPPSYGLIPNPFTSAANLFSGSTSREGFAFEAGQRGDNSTVDVVVKYTDIPIDLRRGISTDLERELGRKPSEEEVVQRYEDFVQGRDPTPIVEPAPYDYENSWPNRALQPLSYLPGKALMWLGDEIEQFGNNHQKKEDGPGR
ncbi:D-alanyl-D-alanine carboxypeptidase family protein [Mesorhizobium qingshengii]|uniref:D-alanyl-D-alanine carboxypeptidase family protein n=1 Tax=Mesorhizobium qingshengii TaxID=1165689 RepID=A0ABT4R0R2_9HYPH|nr:D-alanyl-D-alanine carboxypeptidase family protein [Mesorhizobium qingshengii]MCZ8547168.1 D-alanyl-D-alanine carboxypeptidase family protein [Mesorhizobium qingshengii]